MLGGVLRIHWHDRQPVFSADFDPNDGGRVATAGGDNNVRVFCFHQYTAIFMWVDMAPKDRQQGGWRSN